MFPSLVYCTMTIYNTHAAQIGMAIWIFFAFTTCGALLKNDTDSSRKLELSAIINFHEGMTISYKDYILLTFEIFTLCSPAFGKQYIQWASTSAPLHSFLNFLYQLVFPPENLFYKFGENYQPILISIYCITILFLMLWMVIVRAVKISLFL